ncbi:oxidoreductase, YhhX family [Alkalibacterium sp. AK22]|uniref:Gfo/Idh/MocA family oxidoreductase n=1 Tax=Alkalibacterium sp. AK22 TaxID=1229520 RepID=UPI0004455589|nr:Gfo/Idh/MocA family oxidoreductase [Alkalibacterium sp. AK22]EXJ24354.1 oxidoreductase, YhhX family [Alkalibacterium sp. AK22]
MLTIAYIGNGKSTNRYHIPFSSQVQDIRIKTIYSRSQQSDWAQIEGVEYVHDIDRLWQDDAIDLVVLSTPPHTHYDLTKEALENGKHVLCEKPFTETADEARELFELAKAKGLHLQCYQNRRFDSDFLTVQQVIDSGRLGDILEVEMHFDYYRPEIPERIHDFDQMGSFLYSHACHTVDQVLSYFGDPDTIHYDVRQLLGKGRMNDYFDLDFYYPNNLKVSVKSSYFRLKERPSFIVYGTRGTFVKEKKDRQEEHLKMFYLPTQQDFGQDLPEHYGTLTYMDEAGVYHEEKVVSETGSYSRFYEVLYQTVVNGRDKLVKDQQTIRQIEILEEGIRKMKKY